MIINIACSTDSNYVQHCMAMLCSLLENNKCHDIHVHLFGDNLSTETKSLLTQLVQRYNQTYEFYTIDNKLLKGTRHNHSDRFPLAAYYRLLFPSVISEKIHKLLYLDCDAIIMGDIKPLVEIDLQGYALAATPDNYPDSDKRHEMGLQVSDRTFCSGVMLINLDYWRVHNSQLYLIKYLHEHSDTILPDQEALNSVFRGQWFMLPPKWSRPPCAIGFLQQGMKQFDQEEYAFNPQIFHYSSFFLKPWYDIAFPGQELYWRYIEKSGFSFSKVTKISIRHKVKAYSIVSRYYFSKYVYPLIPEVIEIPCRDTLFIIRSIIEFSQSLHAKRIMMHRWIKKHH